MLLLPARLETPRTDNTFQIIALITVGLTRLEPCFRNDIDVDLEATCELIDIYIFPSTALLHINVTFHFTLNKQDEHSSIPCLESRFLESNVNLEALGMHIHRQTLNSFSGATRLFLASPNGS